MDKERVEVTSEIIWRRVNDDPPTKNGRYLVCTKWVDCPIYTCICQYPLPPVWSQLIEGAYERNDEVYWWTEIPSPPTDLPESVDDRPTVKYQPLYGMKL